jgi:hypothetical protein
MTRIPPTFCLLFLAAATAAAEGEDYSTSLVLHPAASPIPALKYPLLPELRDTIPGNAVTHYRQAVNNLKQDVPPESEWYAAMDQWMAAPLKDFPREEVGKFLKKCARTFQEVEAGARSEQCDWGLTEELRKKGIAKLLPDMHEMRVIATFLTLRIRYELAEGRLDQAARTLQTGFALVRHICEGPTLSGALVGLAIASRMEARLEEFIQQPNAPNLYWSLTDLPRPVVDLRKGMQGERVETYGTFPGMAEMAADLNAKPFTPEQVEKAVAPLLMLKENRYERLRLTDPARTARLLAARHQAAKKILIDQGRPKELVDAMPHFQVGLLLALQQYDQALDEYIKLETLPYPGLRAQAAAAEKRTKEMFQDKDGPAIPLAENLQLPALIQIYHSRTRLDRRFAAMRCVEAVRLYAAAHDGKLPSSLEHIKDAPAPLDPVTGKAFDYHVAGDRAFLTCMPFPGQTPSNANTPSFELILKK